MLGGDIIRRSALPRHRHRHAAHQARERPSAREAARLPRRVLQRHVQVLARQQTSPPDLQVDRQ